MRAALWLISLFALAAAGAWLAGHNQGTVTLFLSPLRVDVSLNLAVLAFLLVVLLVVLAQKALAALLSLPKQAQRWRVQQKERAAHADLLDAIGHFMAGRFLRARKAAESVLDKEEHLREAGVDIPKLARDGVTIFFTQVFRDGFFHADMHPGNIQVSLDPATFGRYISLDFGIVGTLTEHDKEYLAQNFTAFFRRDYRRVAELHIESGWVPPDTRVDELEAAIRAVCEPYFDRPLKEISLGMVLMRLFQTSRRFQVEIQPQLVLLQKTLLNIEGLGRDLDPELDLWSTAKPFLEQWMLEQVGPQRLLAQLKAEAPQYAKLLPAIPRLLHDYLKHRPDDLRRDIDALVKESRRTHRLLQTIIYGGVGFVLGLIVTQIVIRIRLF